MRQHDVDSDYQEWATIYRGEDTIWDWYTLSEIQVEIWEVR